MHADLRVSILTALAFALGAGGVRADGLATELTGLPALTEEQVGEFTSWQEKATAALRDGKPSKAERHYMRAIAIHEGNSTVWYNLACARGLDGDADGALDALEMALDTGWRDAAWPGRDTDLAILHGTPGFEGWTSRVKDAAEAAETWPEVPAAMLEDDPDRIAEVADAWEDEIQAIRGVIGRRQTAALRRRAAWIAGSWDRIAARADSPESRAEASLAALRAVTGGDASRLSAVAAGEALQRAEAFLAEFPQAEHAPDVALTLARARHVRDSRSTDEAARAAASERFDHDLLVLAATAPRGEALEGALIDLLGRKQEDLGMARRLHARLLAVSADADATRERLRGDLSTRGVSYRIEGLPEFSATTLDGRTITAAGLKGQVTLLDFWATWCGPCKVELPHLKDAYARYHDRGFEIIGISLDKAADVDQVAFQAWCEENGVEWPQVYDGQGWQAALAETFGVHAIPFALLLDESGQVAAADRDLSGELLLDRVGELIMQASETAAVGGQ